MRIPNLAPLILRSPGEETQCLAVFVFFGEAAKTFASLGVSLGAAQSDALELARFDVVRLEPARAFGVARALTRGEPEVLSVGKVSSTSNTGPV